MDQLAWLNAVPDVKRKKDDDRPRLSRREQYERGAEPYDEPPPPDHYDYLLSWWADAGMVSSNGMGTVPLSRLEIKQYSDDECIAMRPWERSHLVKLSRRYCWAQNHFKQAGIPAPYISDETIQEKQELDESRKAMAKRMAALTAGGKQK